MASFAAENGYETIRQPVRLVLFTEQEERRMEIMR